MTSYGMGAINCTNYPPLQSNPDIDGIGVLIGFAATSYLTFICCATKAYFDSVRDSTRDGDTKTLDLLSFVLDTTIISFSDQQVVTGISVLIAGITQLEWGIDSYHWETVANLAWFSAFTHIITLTVINKDNIDGKKLWLWIVRFLLMAILIVMLIVALYPVGYIMLYTSVPASIPAWCLYHTNLPWYSSNGAGYNWLYITLTLSILFFSYVTRVLHLFSCHLFGVLPWVIHSVIHPEVIQSRKNLSGLSENKWIESQLAAMGSTWLRYRLLRPAYAVLIAGKQMFSSTYWELTWLLLALAWGTARMLATRQTGGGPVVGSLIDILSQENTWAFGQVVTMGLLFLPLISFCEAFLNHPDEGSLRTEFKRQNSSPLNNSNNLQVIYRYPPTEEHSPTPLAKFSIENGIKAEKWYDKLVLLWYLLSINIGADLIYTFPATNGAVYFTSSSVSISIFIYYIIWFLLDLGLLWIPTILFMDDAVQEKWMNSRVGQALEGKTMKGLCWVALLVLFGISVFFDYWIDAQGITWIDNLE